MLHGICPPEFTTQNLEGYFRPLFYVTKQGAYQLTTKE